jgi:hypothetical protein
MGGRSGAGHGELKGGGLQPEAPAMGRLQNTGFLLVIGPDAAGTPLYR